MLRTDGARGGGDGDNNDDDDDDDESSPTATASNRKKKEKDGDDDDNDNDNDGGGGGGGCEEVWGGKEDVSGSPVGRRHSLAGGVLHLSSSRFEVPRRFAVRRSLISAAGPIARGCCASWCRREHKHSPVGLQARVLRYADVCRNRGVRGDYF